MIVQTRVIKGTNYQTNWAFDNYGRLISENFANDSYKVSYGYDTLSRINTVKVRIQGADKDVVKSITYEPYGGIKSWTYGNDL